MPDKRVVSMRSNVIAVIPGIGFALVTVTTLLSLPAHAYATPLLGSNLSGFAVLGASTVTNTDATTIGGDVGVSPGTAITGAGTISITGVYHSGNDPVAVDGQDELVTAITNLGSLGPGTTEPVDLSGLVLPPGVYTVPAGVSNLTGTLTLDGGGNANAAWVFLMPSTLITSPGSVVNVINTGAGAGIYWDVGSSATIDTTTSFEGNILSLASITLDHAATIGCGRALAETGAVTMDNNTVDANDCMDPTGAGSDGYSGGLSVTDSTVTFLPFAPVSEPGSLALLGVPLGMLTVMARRRKAAKS
jgi:hypothetical protein